MATVLRSTLLGLTLAATSVLPTVQGGRYLTVTHFSDANCMSHEGKGIQKLPINCPVHHTDDQARLYEMTKKRSCTNSNGICGSIEDNKCMPHTYSSSAGNTYRSVKVKCVDQTTSAQLQSEKDAEEDNKRMFMFYCIASLLIFAGMWFLCIQPKKLEGRKVKMPVQILTAVLCFIGCAVFMWVPYLLDGAYDNEGYVDDTPIESNPAVSTVSNPVQGAAVVTSVVVVPQAGAVPVQAVAIPMQAVPMPVQVATAVPVQAAPASAVVVTVAPVI